MPFTIVGICMLLFCALYLCRMSGDYFERVEGEYREILSLLYTIKQKISTSGQRLSVILSNADGYILLNEYSFLGDARSFGLYSSFEKNKHKFIMKKDDKIILSDYFRDAGKGMLRSELENVEICIKELEKSHEKIKAESPSKKKVHNTLIICTALLCIILIV